MLKDYDSGYAVYRAEKMVDDGRNWFEECKMIANDYNGLMQFRNVQESVKVKYEKDKCTGNRIHDRVSA